MSKSSAPARGLNQQVMYLSPSDSALQDVEIRKYGFSIHSRPAKGETLWERAGHIYRQEEVLLVMEKENPLPVQVEAEERPAYKGK